MSNSTTRRFVILSSDVNTSEDVFNNLVLVRDKETGEEGTLLCSHMCNWPQELFSQATWLEGCKTPDEYKDEPRLALGYHPDQYTQWRVYKETNEIEIYLTGSWGQDTQDEDQDEGILYLHTGLPYTRTRWEGGNEPIIPPSLLRLFRRVTHSNEGRYNYSQEMINQFESLVHRLFNAGRIDGWTASVLGSYLFRELDDVRIHWEGPPDLFLPEGTTAFYDIRGIFTSDKEDLPLTYSSFLKQWEVTRSVPGYYQKAVECCLEFLDENEEPAIWYGDPDSLVLVDDEDNLIN